MLLSNVKYQDPTRVLESIVDDNGQGISIYEQKDIGEFFINLLDRLQDGLGENKKVIRKMMGNDFAQNLDPGAHDAQLKMFLEIQKKREAHDPCIDSDVFSED